ncbi:50S ribosomal protein L16 [Candidatus Woesearchaeota archaeon]|jgi:large subunit ribosomal protein L10e|nr:50S ribosomal protein L16 [Candidatus Woesearchaeota archaeon]
MARLKKGVTYRRVERPYTRKSKYRALNYVRAVPVSKIVRYDMGNLKKKYSLHMDFVSQEAFQLRHNAIESARLTCNRYLEKNLGKGNYHFKIRIYPHHVIKENPLATGAGADRMSTGMKKAFGKPIGVAAQVKKNQILFSVGVDKQHKEVAKHSLKRISYKLPFKSKVLERD